MSKKSTDTIFLGNLPAQVNPRLLHELCCQVGNVERASAEYAVELFDRTVMLFGRMLRVSFSNAPMAGPGSVGPQASEPAPGLPSHSLLSHSERLALAETLSRMASQSRGTPGSSGDPGCRGVSCPSSVPGVSGICSSEEDARAKAQPWLPQLEGAHNSMPDGRAGADGDDMDLST